MTAQPAVGSIETKGFPGILAAADAMVKAGRITLFPVLTITWWLFYRSIIARQWNLFAPPPTVRWHQSVVNLQGQFFVTGWNLSSSNLVFNDDLSFS